MLQSQDALSMVALGVLGNVTPHHLQPRITDGVHLRWSPGPLRAFPWHGYHLFRREHQPGQPRCVVAPAVEALKEAQAAGAATTMLPFGAGQFTSDLPIISTDLFPAAGQAELDLAARSWLRFALPDEWAAWQVEVTVGLLGRDDAETCVEFAGSAGERENSFTERGATFRVHNAAGNPAPTVRFVAWGGQTGLDVGFRLHVKLPCAAAQVRLTAASFSADATVTAIDGGGNTVDSATVAAGGVARQVVLRGHGITQLVLDAPQDETVLYKLCFVCGDGRSDIAVRAYYGAGVVAEDVARAPSGSTTTLRLRADAITAVVLDGGPGALVELCYRPVGLGRGWEPLKGFPYPMSLPVRHPDYPASGGRPTDAPTSWTDAGLRVRYGAAGDWAVSFPDLHERLLQMVSGGPGGPGMAASASTDVPGVPSVPDPAERDSSLSVFRDLSWSLLAALHPAVAQMLGLYWLDDTAIPGTAYDYLIVADDAGSFGGNADKALTWANGSGDPSLADAWICYGVAPAPDVPPEPPADIRAYALPGAPRRTGDGSTVATEPNNAGLRWSLPAGSGGASALRPGSPVLYVPWRCDLGTAEPAAAPDPSDYQPVRRTPVLVGTPPPRAVQRPPDWPPVPLHLVDSGLPEGWYTYRVSSIDVFGRHSRLGDPAPWYQWAPEPDPRPWYFTGAAGDTPVHLYAVALLDKVAPPPPTALQAQALDPLDPMVLTDAAYDAWRAARPTTTGVRVRWRWTLPLTRQAPDAKEFRIYLRPGRFNALRGTVTAVAAAGTGQSLVTTDIASTEAAGAYTGAVLQLGGASFAVLGSEAGTPLRLRVRNHGPAQDRRPALAAATLVLTPTPLAADSALPGSWPQRVHVVDIAAAVGSGIEPVHDAHGRVLVGIAATVAGAIVALDTDADLTAVRPGVDWMRLDADTLATDRLVVAVDPAARTVRLHSAPAIVGASAWQIGMPFRQYEVLLPATGTDDLLPQPTLPDPVQYAQVGISTADDRTHTADLAAFATGAFGGRTGNEGTVAGPREVLRVRRTPPDPPQVPPPDADRVYATPADYHARSYFTYRWVPAADLRTHVFRASDESVFAEDWRHRPRGPLAPTTPVFPPGPHWTAARKAAVVAELNALNTTPDRDAALVLYRALSNDALCVLAGLPQTARAFHQLTVAPLDPADPATADRRGPDSPAGYVPSAALRAYTDALDGRSGNRFFYRSAYVDAVHNAGPLSLATPPVWLPDVVPPRTPRVMSVTGGDGTVVLRWWTNREPDLQQYRIYRTEDPDRARDVRLMDLVATVPVPIGDPAAWPAEVAWEDPAPVCYADLRYRLSALDAAGNESIPSTPLAARAYSSLPPDPPAAAAAAWTGVGEDRRVRVMWTARPGLAVLVERAAPGTTAWRTLGWSAPGVAFAEDTDADPAAGAQYRLRARNSSGRQGPPGATVAVGAAP